MRLAGLALACLLAIPDAATAEAPPQATPADASAPAPPVDFETIESAIVGGRLTQARLMLGKLDLRAAQGPRFDLLLGRYYLAQRQDALALERFERVLAVDPHAPAAAGAGIAGLRLGRRDQARAWLLKAVEHDPRDAQAWNGLAVIADAARDWKGAEQAYRQALVIRPDDPAILNNYGYSLIRQRRFGEAVPLLDRARKADPRDAIIRTNHELALALGGRYPPVAGASEADGDIARRLNNAGYVAWLNGDVPAARALLARAIEASPAHYGLAERNLEIVEGGHTK